MKYLILAITMLASTNTLANDVTILQAAQACAAANQYYGTMTSDPLAMQLAQTQADFYMKFIRIYIMQDTSLPHERDVMQSIAEQNIIQNIMGYKTNHASSQAIKRLVTMCQANQSDFFNYITNQTH